MRTPLRPIWDIALKHWDEVIPTDSDYAACIDEINATYSSFAGKCEWGDEWTSVDLLLAAFWYRGYRDTIPGLIIDERIADIGATLVERMHYEL